MSGLKISELPQPVLNADQNIRATDLIPIARLSSSNEVSFALHGSALLTNLNSVGAGVSLYGPKGFDFNTGNYYPIKSVAASAPVTLNDDGSTITLGLSGTVISAIAGLTPVKATFYGTGTQIYFNLPLVTLPSDPSAYRVDINGSVREPGVDYTIITTTSPYQLRFTAAPNLNDKIVVVAFAPSANNSNVAPIIPSNSILANSTVNATNATGLVLNTNQVLCNTSNNSVGLTGVSINSNQILGNSGSGIVPITVGNNQVLGNSGSGITPITVSETNAFVGNIGSGLQAINLSKWKYISTSYNIDPADFSNIIAMNSSSPLVVTIPNNNFSPGFQVTIIRLGTGSVSFSPTAGAPGTASGTGVILNQAYGLNQLASRWSAATLVYSGTPSDGWTLFGDLA